MFGFVASTTSLISARRDPLQQLVDPQVLGLDAVERRERAAEDVVEAAVLVRPLERDHVDGLLDDADDGAVAARVEADRAELLLGQVAALAAEADALLDLLDRVRERDGLVLLRREDVERESLRRPRADPGQPRQLRDEVVHRGAQHHHNLPVQSGRPVTRATRPIALDAGDEARHRVDRLCPREALPADERAPRLELERVPDRRSDALAARPAL